MTFTSSGGFFPMEMASMRMVDFLDEPRIE
jgi:hypothetical protein